MMKEEGSNDLSFCAARPRWGRSEFGKLYNFDKKFRKTLCNLPIAIYP